MRKTKEDLIKARLKRSEESFAVAQIAIERNFWNTAASELYYTCFYLITALFTQNDIKTSTHAGVKTLLACTS